MKINTGRSFASPQLICLLLGLSENYSQRSEFEKSCQALWPQLEIYKGHNHWRIMPFGNDFPARSIYVYIEEIES